MKSDENNTSFFRNSHEQAETDNFKQLAIINCCSVVNKHVDLEEFLRLQNIQLVMGTESHLNESFLNSEVFPIVSILCIERIEISMEEVCLF